MKIEEAIAYAKEQTEIFAGKHRVFLYLAIEALEEIQAYRAIGTVEELQKKMEELERWHTDKINENIKNPFAYTSTYICHNCDHKDEYIEELESEVAEYKSIGSVEEFKALKEADMKGANRAVDEFANYLYKIAKENNGLRLSSETRSWTHPCIFDYLEDFKNEQTCKAKT